MIALIAEGRDATDLRCEIDRIKGLVRDDPADMLYSDKSEHIVSYRQKVLEIEADKDDFLYSLAGHKGETIESLGRKTLSEIMSFAERLATDGRH